MENISTYQHAEIIAESYINGQRKQAVNQFITALSDNCSATALLTDIMNITSDSEAIINIGGMVIEKTCN